jgi:hypothetical protein
LKGFLKKKLLQITSGCVKEVKLGAHEREIKLRAIEKDGIKINISKREDITSVGTVCITDHDSWPSDQNPHERRAAVRSTRDHRSRMVLQDKEDASSLLPHIVLHVFGTHLFSLLQFKYVLLNASIPEVYYTIISRV